MSRLQRHLQLFSNEILLKTNQRKVSSSSEELGTFKIESHEINENFDFSKFLHEKEKALDELSLIEEKNNSFLFNSEILSPL